jgi:hypothetical protein
MRCNCRHACALLLAAAVLAGCASVSTRVTVLDPAQKFAPASDVAILFDYPSKPYTKLALIESEGLVGGTEAELLEDARKRAAALGADAVVRLEVKTVHYPPMPVYDPTYATLFYSPHRYPYRYFYYPPYPYPLFPYDSYRLVGGGDAQALKAMAIRFTDKAPAQANP